MAKARTPSVVIQFGGESRRLIFDFNARAELQDLAGTYASDVAHLKAMRAAVWAGLLAETLDARGRETSRTLSIIQVGEILGEMVDDPEGIAALTAAVQEALGISDVPEGDRPTIATPPPQA